MSAVADERALAAVTADLLRQGGSVHAASVGLTVVAALGIALLAAQQVRPWSLAGMSAALLLGLIETWLAVRVGFDRRILQRLAGAAGEFLEPSQFDRTLVALGLGRSDIPARPMTDRVRGCARLLRAQVVAFVLQIAAVLLGGWLAVLA